MKVELTLVLKTTERAYGTLEAIKRAGYNATVMTTESLRHAVDYYPGEHTFINLRHVEQRDAFESILGVFIVDEERLDDLKKVIDKKVADWKGTQYQIYLRPETLFNATKFESYINGLETKQNTTKVVRDYDEREYTNEQFDSMITRIDDIIVDDI